jgi:FkbM family methyltransferase
MVKPDLLTKRQEEYFEKYLIWEFFDFSCEGFFVDVGAFHSKEFSQTWLLEKVGWKGILIEPLPENADELRKNRPLSVVYQTAISCREKAGVATFYVNSGYSTLVPNITDNRRKYINQITVSVTTLNEVLDKEGNPKIDFLSIDVEGGDLDCLRGLNLEQNHPRLILTEDGVLSLDLHNYLLSEGYRLLRRTQGNNWYVPKGCVRYPLLLEKLKLFRKMYLGTPLRAWQFKREKARLEKMK